MDFRRENMEISRRDFIKAATVAAILLRSQAGTAESEAGKGSFMRRFGDGRDWFLEKRFGMFVHWGIYSVAGWHEQHMFRKKLSRAEYIPFMKQFNPVKFNPDEWLDIAEQAGMKYLTFTTKHVDGFCMWDTKQTDFNITRTPYAKDALAKLAEACHRRKFPLCLYYSCADMNQKNYPSAGRPYELKAPEPGDEPDLNRYLEFVRAQVRELCTNYGEIHGFWWDANVIKHRDPSINAMIRKLQPCAVINNRGYDEGDFGTPERDWDSSVNTKQLFDKPIEACQSVGFQSWSWREDEDYYSDAHLIRSIQKVLAKGGNYLLNVGPMGDGFIPQPSQDILRHVGKWLKVNGESIYGAGKTPFGDELGSYDPEKRDNKGRRVFNEGKEWRCTVKPFDWSWGKPGKLYFHLFKWPAGKFEITGVNGKIKKSYMLADPEKKALTMELALTGDKLTVRLPDKPTDPIDSVLCVEVE